MGRLYINPTLDKAIRSYCEENGIDDVNAFANRCTMQGFNIVKYGTSPMDNVKRENNGIKDIKKNERVKKEDIEGKDNGKPKESKESGGTKEPEENVVPVKEEKVIVRKIQVIKKK